MTQLTSAEIMSLFLFGTKTPPTNLLDPRIADGPAQPNRVVVDGNEYMKARSGRFVTAVACVKTFRNIMVMSH